MELKITKKAVKFGTGLSIIIPVEICKTLSITEGSLLNVTVSNTGEIKPKRCSNAGKPD